jgi:putative solute:sodium symporter small subunit
MNGAPLDPGQALLRRQRYWHAARRWTFGLLLSWFIVTFGTLFFARELAAVTLFGWPFSFYMAAQGLTLFYLLLVAVYVCVMRRLDNAVQNDLNA